MLKNDRKTVFIFGKADAESDDSIRSRHGKAQKIAYRDRIGSVAVGDLHVERLFDFAGDRSDLQRIQPQITAQRCIFIERLYVCLCVIPDDLQ